MAQKITKWLLITLVLTLGFGQLLRFDVLSVPLYFHDLLVIILLSINYQSVWRAVNRRHDLHSGIPLILCGVGIGLLSAMIIFPLYRLVVPVLYAARFLAYLTLYLALREIDTKIPRRYFFLAGIVTTVIGVAQYIGMPDMRWAQYLGWDDHLNRLTLPHYDPTFTAIMIALPLLLVLQTPEWPLGLLFIIPILLTYSRSVWISLALTGLISLKKKYFLPLLISAILLGLIFLPHRFGEGNNLLRTYSISSRIMADLFVIHGVGWHAATGIGMNTIPLILPDTSRFPNHSTGPNNSYVYIIVTTGILGFIGMILFVKALYRQSKNKPMLLFILIASLFNNVFFYPFVLLWLILTESVMDPSEV